MEEFDLLYSIENRYEKLVRKANFNLLVIPDSNQNQKVINLKYSCSGNLETHEFKNIFGFRIISYYVDKPFTEFWFKLEAKILKEEFNPFYISPLSPEDEFSIIHSLDFYIDHNLFLSPTDLTKMPAVVTCSFPEYSGQNQLFDYLTELNTVIFELLNYSPETTDVDSSIEEVLSLRQGVCQDYAHLFLSVCRKNKIPARYVSGYLNQGEGFIGNSQLHAWAEAYIPDLGWVGFDATNNLLANHHYIKIAHGTDYRDCSPIIGVLQSTGAQKSIHSVTVTNQ
jgi:transglutaminase-like putative cysteine protease